VALDILGNSVDNPHSVRGFHSMMKVPMKPLLYAILVFVMFPLAVSAAVLSLDPAEGSYGPGETFVATVRIDTDSPAECINAIDATIEFPKELIKPIAISKGESLISLWAEEPVFSLENGTIRLVGGIPGGYCGRVIGDPGKTNVVAKIVFSIPGTQIGGTVITKDVAVPIRFSPRTSILLNDGSGSPAPLKLLGAKYVRLLEGGGSGTNEWLDTIRSDTFPPEEFRAEIVRNPNAFDGKFVLVFSTVDKQSGLSHYEITEEDPAFPGMVRGKKARVVPVRATSPYLLSDQELKSKVTVRAFDHAGNQREFVIDPTHGTGIQQAASSGASGQAIIWSIVGLAVAVFAFLLGNVIRNRRRFTSSSSSDQEPSSSS
jgi:hypothetical protein